MKIKILSHNYTGNTLVVVTSNGKEVRTKIVQDTDPNWRQVLCLYKQGNYDDMIPMLDLGQAIAVKFKGNFSVRGTEVLYRGNVVHGYLIDRILFYMRELPNQAERLVNFANNLYTNPNPKVIAELYKFLEHKGMSITDDGCFLAYKGVGGDYYSRTAGDLKILKGRVKNRRVYNGVGAEVVAQRADVCDDSSRGCEKGLHVGSWEYADDFKGDGHLMVVKVNPRDVVSVPDDCSYQKARTCRYVVIAEEGRKLNEIRDINYDKVAASRQKFNRDSLGRFSSFVRDAFGRFAPKQ